MATTTTNLLSWEAFEQLPDDGMHREVLEGESIILPPVEPIHNSIATRIFVALLAIQSQTGYTARMEQGYRLTRKPATWIQPDVSFVKTGRVAMAEREGSFNGAPELAVEVISPSESAADVHRKVELLIEHGSQIVWIVYPRSKKVVAHFADGTARTLGMADKLTLPDLLPGWELPVAKLFE
jgi:Uma2 family endonuclease